MSEPSLTAFFNLNCHSQIFVRIPRFLRRLLAEALENGCDLGAGGIAPGHHLIVSALHRHSRTLIIIFTLFLRFILCSPCTDTGTSQSARGCRELPDQRPLRMCPRSRPFPLPTALRYNNTHSLPHRQTN